MTGWMKRIMCALFGHVWYYTWELNKYCIRCQRVVGKYGDKLRGKNIGGEE